MDLQIRKSKIEDIPRIMEMIEQAKIQMAKVSDQWQNGYPNAETIRMDIENGVSYVLVDTNQDIVGSMALIEGPDSNYSYIEGKWRTEHPYYVIHRIVVAEEYKGQGLAHTLFAYAKEKAEAIRIDTHENNHSMQRAIEKEEFTYCGIVYVGNHEKRLAFEWDC